MPKVLVLFYSRTGNTAKLADAVAAGAGSVKFTEVELRRVDDLTPQSVIDASEQWKTSRAELAKKYRTLESIEYLAQFDALIIGGPARYGILSAELKATLDRAAPLWTSGALRDKVGSAFGTVGTPNDGHDTNIMSMVVPMMHLGMIIVPADHASGADTFASARNQGARVAKVAEWVRHAKSHEAHKH